MSAFKAEGSKTWEKDVAAAQRAVVMRVQNFTAFTLLNSRTDLWHGSWRLFPPGTD